MWRAEREEKNLSIFTYESWKFNGKWHIFAASHIQMHSSVAWEPSISEIINWKTIKFMVKTFRFCVKSLQIKTVTWIHLHVQRQRINFFWWYDTKRKNDKKNMWKTNWSWESMKFEWKSSIVSSNTNKLRHSSVNYDCRRRQTCNCGCGGGSCSHLKSCELNSVVQTRQFTLFFSIVVVVWVPHTLPWQQHMANAIENS